MERDEFVTMWVTFRVQFQSTRSAWSATSVWHHPELRHLISIHALRMERDTPPRASGKRSAISIHALRMERDPYARRKLDLCRISIHALRMERDGRRREERAGRLISIHALRMERDFEVRLVADR